MNEILSFIRLIICKVRKKMLPSRGMSCDPTHLVMQKKTKTICDDDDVTCRILCRETFKPNLRKK